MHVVLVIFKWIGIVLLGLVIFLLLALESFDRYLATEKGALWMFRKVDQPKSVRWSADGTRFLEIGSSEKPPLLFIHGAPRSLFDGLGIARHSELYDHYRLLLVERPGYGAT